MTPLRFGACEECARSIPIGMSLCFDCVAQGEPAQQVPPPLPTVSVIPPLSVPDWISSESTRPSAEALAEWAQEQYDDDLKIWEGIVKGVRWQSMILIWLCLGLFLIFQSWPFVALVVAVTFISWRRIRRAQSLRPVKPRFD